MGAELQGRLSCLLQELGERRLPGGQLRPRRDPEGVRARYDVGQLLLEPVAALEPGLVGARAEERPHLDRELGGVIGSYGRAVLALVEAEAASVGLVQPAEEELEADLGF